MRTALSLMILAFLAEALCSCSSAVVKDKFNSPEYRVAIDPTIFPATYSRIREAVFESGKFFVVDRRDGFYATMAEQNLEHGDLKRFSDRERYARLSQLYGVGGIIIAGLSCGIQHHSFLFFGREQKCAQTLGLVNAATGELIAQVTNYVDVTEDEFNLFLPAAWTETVQKLIAKMPEHFEMRQYSPQMQSYRNVVEEESIRESAEKREGETDDQYLDRMIRQAAGQ